MQNTLWNDVLTRLEKRINRPSFNTWIRPTCLVAVTQPNVQVGVPEDVFVYWLGEYYVNVIADTLAEILGFQPEISFVVMDRQSTREHPEVLSVVSQSPQTKRDMGQVEPARGSQPSPPLPGALVQKGLFEPEKLPNNGHAHLSRPEVFSVRTDLTNTRNGTKSVTVRPYDKVVYMHSSKSLNPNYTFDSYVVGNNNRLAHAAALAVAEQGAVNYNPLFLYGGVGLGKTHLLHAIGNHVAVLRQTDRILYLSSEQFINELIFSIREDRMTGFRDKYRNIDVLLVDDIQFIGKKERTQEEFFHTFNTLYHDRKQIVLTSDCPPKKMPTVAEQLRSRFEWGLIADIQPPELETRIAILKKKADLQHFVLPDEVALFIASKVTNVRELEGCLSKIRAYATFNKNVVSLELAQKGLRDLFDLTPKKVTVELVQKVVANHYQVRLETMRSHDRSRDITLPRQIAMYLARELTGLSLPDIGKNFGGRDHTTVLHACKKVADIQAQDKTLQEHIMHMRDLIRV
jgi:chromosomal replication initiator protein